MELQNELVIEKLLDICTSYYNSKGLYGFTLNFPNQLTFDDYILPEIALNYPDFDLELVHRFYNNITTYFHWFATMYRGKPNFLTFDEYWKGELRSKILYAENKSRPIQQLDLETKVA